MLSPHLASDRVSSEHLPSDRARYAHLQSEIERMRYQVSRQRKDIAQLAKAKINTLPAEALLARMLVKIENLCAQRDKLRNQLGLAHRKRGVA
jgi:hypothetical protein